MAEANSEAVAMHQHTNALPASGCAAMQRGTPQHYALREAIFRAGQECLRPQSRMLDLHCGEGDFVEPFIERNEDLCRFVLLDPSEEKVRACSSRFHVRAHLGYVIPGGMDLANGFPELSSSLMLCVLGLSPLDLERREEVLEKAHRHLERGGGLIVVEELRDEETCASWQDALHRAGFRQAERIWSSGRTCAWMAKK